MTDDDKFLIELLTKDYEVRAHFIEVYWQMLQTGGIFLLTPAGAVASLAVARKEQRWWFILVAPITTWLVMTICAVVYENMYANIYLGCLEQDINRLLPSGRVGMTWMSGVTPKASGVQTYGFWPLLVGVLADQFGVAVIVIIRYKQDFSLATVRFFYGVTVISAIIAVGYIAWVRGARSHIVEEVRSARPQCTLK